MFKQLTKKLPVVFALLAFAIFSHAQAEFVPSEMIVSASALKLRAQADVNSAALETLPRGTIVQVVGVHNNGEVVEVNETYAPWYQVKTNTGKTGYVFGAYVVGTYGLYYEGEPIEGSLPPLNWYGVYRRDSFSDELRRIEVRVQKQYSEMFEQDLELLITNQKDTSKFIIGTTEQLKTGYAGPLGIMDSPGWFFEGGLQPGSMLPISSGQLPGDTTFGQTYFLAATGCAMLKDNYVQVNDYKLQVVEAFNPDGNNKQQDITQWVRCLPDMNPTVQLLWYGDIDQDKLPDALIHDCPFEMGCRASLYLSSKAKPGEILHKMCEYFWFGD
jgi:hypothetical protein